VSALFISDLHVDDTRPHVLAGLKRLIDADADVGRLDRAFEAAERDSRPAIALVTSADGYLAGT